MHSSSKSGTELSRLNTTLESGFEPKASFTLARSLISATFVKHCDINDGGMFTTIAC
jgi:hypothetical protein